MAGSAFAGCVVRPEQTDGPYFVDDMLNRSDVRSDHGIVKPGGIRALRPWRFPWPPPVLGQTFLCIILVDSGGRKLQCALCGWYSV